jgi:3',5'-cyclic AMP phosphodiesterase CpdA
MKLRRREFLVGLGGSVILTSRALAETRTLPEFTFHIVSDTHIGRQDNEAALKQWKATVAELNAASGAFVLHLGDVVDSGREAQYPVYLDVRKTINKPVHEIPGNHDPQDLFAKYIRPQIDTSFGHGGVRFVLFNNSDRESHMGFIKPPQLEWLKSELAAAAKADQFVVLCCHVPVHTNAHPDRGWYVKPADGQTEFYALLEQHKPRVLALFHGHFHNGIRGWDDHKPYIESLFPSCCYNQDRKLVNHPMLSGFVIDDLRIGYTNVTLGGGKMTLAYKPLGAESKAKHETAIS